MCDLLIAAALSVGWNLICAEEFPMGVKVADIRILQTTQISLIKWRHTQLINFILSKILHEVFTSYLVLNRPILFPNSGW